MRVSFGLGLIVCVLVPIVLLLFGVIDISQSASAILLLAGLWAVVFGLAFGRGPDRLYNVGVGLIVIAISTFLFLPLAYVVGLVLIVVILIVLAAFFSGARKSKP